DLDFSFIAEGEGPDLTCFKGEVDFFTSGEYLDLLLGDDLDCSSISGEEPDLLRLGDNLDFFNFGEESILCFPSGEMDFFFGSEEDPDEGLLGGEADLSLTAGGDLDLLCLRTGDLDFSLAARDLPDLLRCNGGVDFGSREVARLGGDKEFSFADD
ncbi:UNVERIFIED_CONTAM: hypothetical protein K2H54_039988, partial [Gekko kuhli]